MFLTWKVDPLCNAKVIYPPWISEEDQVLMEYTFGGCLAVYDVKNGTSKIPMIQSIYGDFKILGLMMEDNIEVCVESLISPCF